MGVCAVVVVAVVVIFGVGRVKKNGELIVGGFYFFYVGFVG